MHVGADTGGTFTDVVADDGRVAKVLSDPTDPAFAVRRAVEELSVGGLSGPAGDGIGRPALLAHGTTVATNALLERRGAPVALVTTEGFADVLEIARQDRPSLYDPWADRPEPLVPRPRRFEVTGRLAADGTELEPVDAGAIPPIGDDVACVAVCLLHADLEPCHEQAVGDELRRRGHDVSCSHEVSPELREYERTITTVINAYLRPPCRRYLRSLAASAGDPVAGDAVAGDAVADEVLVMTSAGGLMAVERAADRPATLLLSGPAGGVRAAAAVAVANGVPDALTFDMGGTSTDVALVLDGVPEPAAEREVAGFPVRLPSLDVHTVGAGGGSIARLDPGGALVVGPESAGADPGPACYGQGGAQPTVTDADLVAGRIPADTGFGGLGRLDAEAAEQALATAGVEADGVIDVVDATMVQALRVVSVERGVDPRRLALVAFGGAGPLHACALADALGIERVIVPDRAGVLSAVGLLAAPRQVDIVRSRTDPADHVDLDGALSAVAVEAAAELRSGDGASTAGEVEVTIAVDCRYAGQSHELTVATPADFAAEHERRNGYAREGAPIEVVAMRATARHPAPMAVTDLPSRPRSGGVGPCVLAEPECTVWVAEGWQAEAGEAGALVLTRRPAGREHPKR